MSRVSKFFTSRIIIFCIQFLILSIFLFLFQYIFIINFDVSISDDHRWIIQFLGNYILYDDVFSFLFIFVIWISISFLPIIIFKDVKKSYTINLTTFFFPNFFFYVFLERYSKIYFTQNFSSLLVKTLILGFSIVIISIGSSLILKNLKYFKKQINIEDIKLIAREIKTFCPNCGTEFNSIPEFCYKCNRRIIPNNEDNIGQKK